MNVRKHILPYLFLTLLAIQWAGCSTTKRLADGEVLYTGVKKMKFESADDSLKVIKSAVSAAKKPLSVKPNNPLISPYVRTPLPIGLWAWNYLYTPEKKGLKAWLYRRFAKEPVLMSDVKPDVRVQVADQILENYGYFGVRTDYEIIPSKNKPEKKQKVSYHATLPAPHTFDSIEYLEAEGELGRIIDTLNRSTTIRPGMVYNVNNLSAERSRISRELRDRGYYYFRPEYIEYLADSLMEPYKVQLRMQLAEDVPPAALKPYRVGDVRMVLFNPEGGEFDSMQVNDVLIRYQQPQKLRTRIFRETLDIHPGELFTPQEESQTLTNLNRLGVFSGVSMNVPPLDSLKADQDSLRVLLNATYDLPMEGDFEVDLTSKSNSFLGPGVIFSLRHKNFFKGAEVFSIRLNGSYEWQTGSKRQYEGESSLINSYEFGVTSSLDFPRLILPYYLHKKTKYPSKTSLQLGADLLNRSGYFYMLSANGSISYNFQTSKYSTHTITPFKLVYNKLLSTSHMFDSTMNANPAIAESFNNQFIASLGYTYTYDRTFGRREKDRVIWQTSVTEAGNIFSGVWGLLGASGTKHIFGIPFSQFAKAVTEIRHYHRVGPDRDRLVTRLKIGAGHAYGNSKVMPYSEQFYIGGANSIRAFTIRSLGPGSYRPSENDKYGYWDQTGTFILEANLEYRFNIAGGLNGAVFMDAGNIWLLKNDPDRPGGKLGSNFWKEIALGTGVGVRYDLSYLVVRLDWGIGIHTPYRNPNKSGYYNISKFKDGMGVHLAIGYPF